MTSLAREKRVLNEEFKILEKKEKQSKSYFQRKRSTSSTSPPSSRSSTPCPVSDREYAPDNNVSGNTESDKDEQTYF